jgi:peptide/nickel transport system substrate-binding protein
MKPRLWIVALILVAPLWTAVTAQGQGAKPAPVGRSETPGGRADAPGGRADAPVGTLTVAVATFGNERWLPHLYVGAEDVVLKPMYENLLSRDPKTGELSPMLAERWKVADGGRTWTFYLRKGVQFHGGVGELTAEDVRFTFATIARDGSANSLAPEFRLIKSMEVENPYTITVRFEKPFVAFGNKVNQGLFASVAFIQSKRHVETAKEDGAERQPVATGPWKFVEHIRGDRIVYEAVENHWRATPHFKRLVFKKVPEPSTRMALLRAGGVDVIEIGGEYADELKQVGIRTLLMPNVAWVYIILGGQWPTKATYDPKVPWAQPDTERARKVRLALNVAVDKHAIMQRVLGGLGTVMGSWLMYPNDPWASDALKKPYPYDPARAKALLTEAGYPSGFGLTMNLTAWPGRGYLPDVGEAVATYWEKVGIKVKRRPVDRAVFSADFRARAYSGVTVAYASPLVAPEPWEVMYRAGYTKAALNLFMEHPKLDEFIDRLAIQPNYTERVRIMRDEMGPWLSEYVPGVAIGAAHAIAGVGPKVGEWPLIAGHMGFHNWEYVSRAR